MHKLQDYERDTAPRFRRFVELKKSLLDAAREEMRLEEFRPRVLTSFISLCDAQRKIEGVYKGRTQTYDLRGKKVCVVMAGNPYTESGEKFQIPDMLANRADVYNLGEIIGDSREAFELSYLENALTSNAVLNKLATRSQKDVHAVIRMAMHDTREGIELEGNYSLEELNEFIAVMKKLLRVRDVLLVVNREYIRSAAQSHDYRTEPPFKLQGSYRNMNRIAEKVVAIMNDQELETLIAASYENDAQTLTSDQESNLLKLKELQGRLTPTEQQRWDDIRRTFQQNVKLRGLDPKDHLSQLLAQLGNMTDGLSAIRSSMNDGLKSLATRLNDDEQAKQEATDAAQLGELKASLDAIATTALASANQENAEDSDNLTQAAANAESILSRVMVQHQVPRVMLEVIQSQFEMMRAFLAPILNSMSGQSEDMKLIQQTVGATQAHYAALLSELQQAKTDSAAPPPPKPKRSKS